MTSLKHLWAATALALAASAQAGPLIDEGFDDITTLAGKGWVLTNDSVPIGTTDWAQGDVSAAGDVFYGDGSTGGGYITANNNSAAAGGFVNNFLITPIFSTETAGTVSFLAKADILDPYYDLIRIGFSSGDSSPFSFSLSPAIKLTGGWVQYTFSYAAAGIGSVARFAIDYTGWANNANYIGIDSFTVTPVPEPSSWALLGLGLTCMVVYSRRRAAAVQAQA
ncbi:MAG TPA: choice-of-anchor J domain-containing protein [Burkholderiaceae bacterium]|nr:choice-of-anchor J domain-containing protein [Burkholderiaceae bacterium]